MDSDTVFTPFRMPVEMGKIREFAIATRARHSMYFSWSRPAIPITFFTTMSFWQTPESSPYPLNRDMSNILNAGQTFTFFGELPRGGDVLIGTSRLGRGFDRFGRRGGQLHFQEYITDFRKKGEMIATTTHTQVEVSTTHNNDSQEISEEQPNVGLTSFVDAPLTISDFVRYQGAAGDFNPIHHDPDFAQQAGYKSNFTVGLLPAGILAGRLAQALGPESIREYDVRFHALSWPNESLTYDATVVDISPGFVTSDVKIIGSIHRPDGSLYLSCKAIFRIEKNHRVFTEGLLL